MIYDYEETESDGLFKTVIVSELPTFARFEDIVTLASEYGVSIASLRRQMQSDEFPRPINEYQDWLHPDTNIEEWGIWIYEAVLWGLVKEEEEEFINTNIASHPSNPELGAI